MTRQRFNRGAPAFARDVASELRPGRRRGRRAKKIVFLCVLCGLCGLHFVTAFAQPPQPAFKSSVEVTSLDVTVVDTNGKPITNLTPADFAVRIDNNIRRVVTAEWVQLTSDDKPATVVAPPEGYSTNENSIGGRLIVMAIDQPNIRFGGAMAISRAANAFVDRLQPADRIAVAGIGPGAPATPFTTDRARIKQTLSRMAGQKMVQRMLQNRNIGLSEALQVVDRSDSEMLKQIQQRECAAENSPGAREACYTEVELQIRQLAVDAKHEADQTIQALRDLFLGLRAIDAPKTLIFISEGFTLSDLSMVLDLGTLAASARTSLYALQLDQALFDVANARMPLNPFADRRAATEGLDMLAGAARGTLFTVTGSAEALFSRIEAELSGYYLLGVESDPRDRDGKPHPIRVDVPRRGAVVRSRRQILNAPSDEAAARAARSPRRAMAAALGSPLLSSALPLRVASFSLQGPERDKVQLLIHADIGTDYPSPKVVSVGYVISDTTGKQIETKAFDVRASPVMNGVPSALQYTAGASLLPGTYNLKLAVAEGDRVGSIEHEIHAALPNAGGLTFSELMAGGPNDAGQRLTPTIGYTVTFGMLHGYVEAYGPRAQGITAEYEVATKPDAPALINLDAPPYPAGDERVIFSTKVQVNQLPPGKYVLRAIFSDEGKAVKTLTRPFEVAPPKVLMTSAEGLGAVSVDSELFLPVDETALAAPFKRDDAVKPEMLEQFSSRIAPEIKEPFEEGIAFLTRGDYLKAQASFKKAIGPDSDSTVPLVYLAAAFAAGGRNIEAASAWQTALIDGSDYPQVYQWLGDALMRERDLGAARTILEEAVGKWPSDPRFTKPLALLYGTFGRGREAVRTLERYISEREDDRDAYFMAVQWIYTVHSEGAAVHGREEDVKLARAYADRYEKAGGPQVPLVKQWIDYLENEGRKN
jgi:VWFA-related protein